MHETFVKGGERFRCWIGPPTVDQLLEAGNEMAAAIEDRWSGPNGCDCEVCTTAKRWRELMDSDHG